MAASDCSLLLVVDSVLAELLTLAELLLDSVLDDALLDALLDALADEPAVELLCVAVLLGDPLVGAVESVVGAALELLLVFTATEGSSSLFNSRNVVIPPAISNTATTMPMIRPAFFFGGWFGGPDWNPGCCQAGCPWSP